MAVRKLAPRDLFGRRVQTETLDRNAEGRRQIAVVEYVRWVAPHIVIFHPANGGWRTRAEAARFKALGVLAGVLDLVLVLPDARCAFWECKTPKGRLSDDQQAMILRLMALGHRWAIVRDIDDARRELAALEIETREAKATDELLALGHACKRASA
jgi:hypothetical protein